MSALRWMSGHPVKISQGGQFCLMIAVCLSLIPAANRVQAWQQASTQARYDDLELRLDDVKAEGDTLNAEILLADLDGQGAEQTYSSWGDDPAIAPLLFSGHDNLEKGSTIAAAAERRIYGSPGPGGIRPAGEARLAEAATAIGQGDWATANGLLDSVEAHVSAAETYQPEARSHVDQAAALFQQAEDLMSSPVE